MASHEVRVHSPAVVMAEESDSATQTDSEFETDTDPESDTDADDPAATSKAYPSPEASHEEVVEGAQLFFEKLKSFHSSFSAAELSELKEIGPQPLKLDLRFPTLGGNELDLHRLYVEVTSRGGLEKVIRDHKWKEVISALSLPSTVTNASFDVRKHYASLLYHFEQAYFFRKSGPVDPVGAHKRKREVSELGSLIDSASDCKALENPTLRPGISLVGTIDEKCDNGYVISVNLGYERMKGFLYHIPSMPQSSWNTDSSTIQDQKQQRKSRPKLRDPAKPKPNRSGYTFFFAEQYAKLRPSFVGQERSISKTIGHMWTTLSEAEKQVYQEKGKRDKERYQNEMQEYKQHHNL